MVPSAIFFDLDDTLIDDDSSFRQALTRICSELAAAHPLDATVLAETYDRVTTATIERSYVSTLTKLQLRQERWREALSELMQGDVTAISDAAAVDYVRYRLECMTTFDDAKVILKALHGSCRLGVITNGSQDGQLTSLRNSGLESYFDVLVTSGNVGRAKPDPAIFRHALTGLGVAPGNAWHVGDSLSSDVAGAKTAGLTAVWLNRRGTERSSEAPSPDYEITQLTELLDIINE